MSEKAKRKPYKKIALLLAVVAIVLWVVLGTGASLAWFTDTTPRIKNIFHFAEFELDVSFRQEDGTYETIEGRSDIFDDEALYEPGYVQVVYLKVKNKGTVPFDFKTAVNVVDYTLATNVFGNSFNLQDYLKFGLITANSEAELDLKVGEREAARAIATTDLGDYSTTAAELGAGQEVFIALVVHMPEEVRNEANYRGDTQPKVELGIIVDAVQKKNQ